MINEKPIKVKTINDKPRSKIDFMTTETIKIGNKKSKNAKHKNHLTTFFFF